MRRPPRTDHPADDGAPGHLVAVVVSHAVAPIASWQPLVLDDTSVRELLERSRAVAGIRGLAVLATCSRTELYAEVDDLSEGGRALRALLQGVHDASPDVMARTQVLLDAPVASHLFRVTAGLESIALGEHEIQGQVRHALQLAADARLTSPLVHRLLERALATGARVRHETAIGHGATTLGHAAAEAVAERVAPASHALVVVVGAGHMAQQAARHFRARGFERMVVVNRTLDAARRLAGQVDARARPWTTLPALLAEASTVVAAVRASAPVIDVAMLEHARARAGTTLQLVDLGSPPNIAPACAALPGVTRIDLDALHARSHRARASRAAEASAAARIVDDEVARFLAWCEHRRLTPAVHALHERFRAEADVVVAREARRWGGDREQLQRLADALVRRLLHRPLEHLHELARDASHAAVPGLPGGIARRDATLATERLVIDAYVARDVQDLMSDLPTHPRPLHVAPQLAGTVSLDDAPDEVAEHALARAFPSPVPSSPTRS